MVDKFFKIESEKGLTEKTLSKYKIDIKQFVKFIGLKTDLDILSIEEVKLNELLRKYISKLESDNYKPASINSKIITINKYLKFLDIDSRGQCVTIQKKTYIDNVISEGEYRRLIDQSKNNIRDRAIIITLANTGLRVSELLSLKINDICNETVLIKGKQGKYREVFLPYKVREILNKYIRENRLKTDKSILFTGERGALKRQSINKILLKYAKRCNVNKKKAHPHSLRHFFGKRLAENKVTLDVIQTYLGHENISTTAIYTKRTKSELSNTLDNSFII